MKSTDIKNHKTSISQTHNLEVLGSSPSWSTLEISNLEEIQVADFSFCENNAKTKGTVLGIKRFSRYFLGEAVRKL